MNELNRNNTNSVESEKRNMDQSVRGGLRGGGLGVRAPPPESPRGGARPPPGRFKTKEKSVHSYFIVNKKPDVTYYLNITK